MAITELIVIVPARSIFETEPEIPKTHHGIFLCLKIDIQIFTSSPAKYKIMIYCLPSAIDFSGFFLLRFSKNCFTIIGQPSDLTIRDHKPDPVPVYPGSDPSREASLHSIDGSNLHTNLCMVAYSVQPVLLVPLQ